MKRLAISLACLGLLNTSAIASINADTEKWSMIKHGSITIPIPQFNFQANKVNESHYQLTWNHQGSATSYKIERLSYDSTATIQGSDIPTYWKEVANTTNNSFDINHALGDFDLNGHQTYRLSSCINAICEELTQLSYFVYADDVQSTIVQNFQIAAVPPTSSANLEIKTQVKKSTKSSNQNPYAEGYGYSMVTGHAPTVTTSNISKTSKDDNQLTQRTIANVETHEYELTWEPVSTANHYIILREVVKANSPTKSFLNSTVHKENAVGTSYRYQLLSGEYNFKVYACDDSNTLLICGGISKTKVINPPDTFEPNEQIQPRNVSYSDTDAKVAYQQSFELQWNNPPIEGDTEKRLDHFEIYGELAGKIATITARGGQSYLYKLERNSGKNTSQGYVPFLDEGRQYCYKVIPIYMMFANSSLVAGEAGYPDDSLKGTYQCVTVGDEVAFQAPNGLRVFGQIANSEHDPTVSVPVTWSPIVTSPAPKNYLVEIQYPWDSGSWRSVYYGSEAYTSLYMNEGNQVIRVSACDQNDICGNYRRIYFWNYNNFSSDATIKSSSCFNVPENVVGNNQIPVNWCPTLHLSVSEYEIVDRLGNTVYSSNTQHPEMKNNGILYATVNNLFGPEEDHRCLTLIARYSDGTSENTAEKCIKTTPNTPTNFDAYITSLEPAEALVQWDGMAGTYRYYINTGFCDNNCNEPTSWQTYTSLYNQATQMSMNLSQGAGKYFYKVRACSQTSTCSDFSNTKVITFSGPDAPVNLVLNLIDPSTPSYELLWDTSPDASSYIIEQASCIDSSCNNVGDSDWSQIGTSTAIQFTLPQVNSNFYAYSVTACHSICGPRSVQLNVDYTKPQRPTGLKLNVVDQAQGQYNLIWALNTVDEISEYKVHWAVCNNNCADVQEADWNNATGSITTNDWSFTVAANEYRTLRVAACRASGICSDYSFAIDMPRNSSAIRYIHTDNLGSPVSETDKDGAEQ